MSEVERSKGGVESFELANEPGIGFIVTSENVDAVIRSVLRAHQRGHVSLIAATQLTAESRKILTDFEVIIVDTDDRFPDDSPREALERTARSLGLPGLIIHEHSRAHVNYHQSLDEWRTSPDYAIEAVTTEDRTDTRTMAAIPAYNEERSIGDVVKGAKPYVDDVLVVNDGSNDETAKRARAAGAIVLNHERNKGYGRALKTAFKEAHSRKVDNLVILDGDDQHNPEDIPKLLSRQQETGAELVVGNRSTDGAETDLPLYRFVGLTIVNALTNLSLGTFRPDAWIQDTQNGFRAYNARSIATLAKDDTIGDHMDASTDVLYHAKEHGYEIDEVGVTIDYDVESGSSHSPIVHGFVLVRNLFGVLERERPFLTLGAPGLVSTILGLGLGYLLLTSALQTGDVSLAYLVGSALFVLIGILGLFASVAHHALGVWLVD